MKRTRLSLPLIAGLFFMSYTLSYAQVEANNDVATIPANGIISVSVLANDNLDNNSQSDLSVEIVSQPASGVAVVNGVNIEYHAPDVNNGAVETFEYKLISPSSEDVAVMQMNVQLPDDTPPVISCPPDVTLFCEPERVCLDGEEYVVPNNTAVPIDTFYTPQGKVPVFGFNPDDPLVNHFAVISSTPAPPSDPDLGTPNEAFPGGTGVGMGGGPGLYQNDNSLGNVFIITDVDGSEDDQCCGATAFTFDFSLIGSGTVTLQNLNVFDVDDLFQQSGAHLKLYDAADVEIASFAPPVTGDNGRYTVYAIDPNTNDYYSGVAKAVYTLNGSGSLGRICFTSDDLTHSTGFATATDDNAEPPTIRYEDTRTILCNDVEIITRLWRAIDCVGNQDTCYQTIYSYNDLVAPDLVCPGDITIECLDSTDPDNTGWASASDACPADITLTYADVTSNIDDCIDQITRTWTAVDLCGNDVTCAQTITITDEPPVVSNIPADVTLECGDPLPVDEPTFSDNCGPDVTVTFEETSVINADGAEVITRTWTGTDGCGQSATVTQIITVISCTNIGDTVWNDLNQDGIQDPGEPGVADVTVQLIDAGPDGDCGTADDVIVDTQVTDANGNYLFEDVAPGVYCIQFVESSIPAGFVFTGQDVGGDDAEDSDADATGITDPFTVTSGQDDDLTFDAGIFDPINIGDLVWNDLNQDGIQDPGEPGVADVTVQLIDAGPDGDCGTADDVIVDTQVTDANGNYLFEEVAPGVYCIQFVESSIPGGFVFTEQDAGGNDAEDSDADATGITDPITVTAGQADDLTIDAGVFDPINIGDTVWNDLNQDGIQDPGEPGVADVTVQLIDAGPDGDCGTADDVIVDTQVTDANGNYLFEEVAPGVYCIQFVESSIPGGFVFTEQDAGGDDAEDSDADATGITDPFTVTVGQNDDLTFDAGVFDPINVGNYVWFDDNRNGIQDDDEIGVPDVTVQLVSAGDDNTFGTADDVIEDTQVTDANGNYLFEEVAPGDYKITFVEATLPADYEFTYANQGIDDTVDSDAEAMGMTIPFTVTAGQADDLSWDAGIFKCTEITVVPLDDITVECDDPVPAPIQPVFTDPVDDDLTVVYSEATIVIGCNLEIKRTWTATNDCGNTKTTNQSVFILDTQAPDLECPADVTLECTADTSPTANGAGEASATDACSDDVTVTVSGSITPGDCPQEYTMVRTWTAVDDCGNSVSCEQTVTVVDSNPPVIDCPADATVECTVDPTPDVTGMATATDACGDVTVTYSDATVEGACPAEYTITRTWTAVDACGNEASCDQMINVLDTGAPVIKHGAGGNVQNVAVVAVGNLYTPIVTSLNNAGYNAMLFNSTPNAAVLAGYDAVILVRTPGNPDLATWVANGGLLITEWNASEWALNTANLLNANDIGVGIIGTNTPVTFAATAEGSILGTGLPNPYADDCATEFFRDLSNLGAGVSVHATRPGNIPATIGGSTGSGYTLVIGYCWSDKVFGCGLYAGSQTETMILNALNVGGGGMGCPPDVTIECTESTDPSNTGMASAMDECSDVTVTYQDALITNELCLQVIQRRWKATDACGNTAECDQVITIVDTTPPDLVCPAEVTIECTDDPNDMALTGTGTATDACNDVTVTYSDDPVAGDCMGNSSIYRVWTATDACDNNTSCVQIIHIVDTQAPDLECPADVTLECTADTSPTANGAGEASATDACSDDVTITVSGSITPGDCPQEYTMVRTWTAVDDCGNSVSCEQTVTVVDTNPPVMTCPPTAIIECTDDPNNLDLTGEATATDACGDVTVSYSDATVEGNCPAEYTITRTWTAVDACGNEASCPQTIEVKDLGDPDLMCAADITIECDESTDPANTGVSTATDECSDVTVTYQEVTTTDELCLQVIMRRWKATDACGNTSECDQLITVKDTQGPEVTAPEDMTVECDASTDTADTGEATATDNCNGETVDYSDEIVLGECEGEYTILRTWTAVDECGNSCEDHPYVGNGDFESGTLAPEWDGIGNTSANSGDGDILPDEGTYQAKISSSNDVGQAALETFLELPGGTLDALGPGDVTSGSAIKQTITAVAGQTLTFRWNFATDELDQPVVFNDFGFVTIVDDNVVILATRLDPGFLPTTNYDGQTGYMDFSHTFTASGTCVLGFGVTDVADNIVESSLFVDAISNGCPVQTIHVVDTTPPVWTYCPDDTTLECTEDPAPGNTGGYASATDACSDVTVSHADVTSEGDCDNEYTIERTWTAVDDCGNNTSKVQTIEVLDTTPPVIECPADATVECTVDPTPDVTGMASAEDACGDVTVTYVDATVAGDCPAEYTITRTWTAVDECGNEASCPQIIMVLDTQAPDLMCAADITIECDESTDPANTGASTATDECSDVTVTYIEALTTNELCLQVITRRWKATDACGNTSECDQLITIVDTTYPDLTCPDNVTIECDESTLPANTGMASATDNCNDLTITYNDDPGQGPCDGQSQIVRVWTATDACGNNTSCTQLIEIFDTTPPVWTSCPADLTVECTESTDPDNTGGYASATDACSDVTVTYADMTAEGDCDNEYTIERTWTATDDCGNNTSKVQTIEVLDTTPPVITCPGDVTVECTESTLPGAGGDGLVDFDGMFAPTLFDNQNTPSNDYSNDGVTFDGSGVANGWEVLDNSSFPVSGLSDPNKLAWNTSATGNTEAINFASPASGISFKIAYSINAGSTVTFNVYNSANALVETQSPVVGSTALTIVIASSDVSRIEITAAGSSAGCIDDLVYGQAGGTGTATAVDACGDVTVTYSDAIAPGDCPAEMTITRTWTAVDACGNESDCDQTIMVLDTQAPDLMCAADITIECDESTDPANTGASTATDECSDVTVTYIEATTTNELCLQVITRRWKATDACGNTSECDQLITIVDTTYPDLTCAADVTIECDESTLPANTGMSVATDNCNDVTVTYNDDPGQGPCVGQSVIYRVWTATDACGNNTSCTQLIEIFDTTPPTITCPGDMTVECDAVDNADFGTATATDVCSDVTVTYADVTAEGDCANEYTIERTWTATDDCGNATDCVQTIEILDTTPPVITCPGDVTVECTENTLPGGVINFDQAFAPVLFLDQFTPTNDYSNPGVTFSGSGLWEVLDLSSFFVTGLSEPNKLAWNHNGNAPNGSNGTESMNFSPSTSSVSFKLAIGSPAAGGIVTIEVYDSNNDLVETQNPLVGSTALTVLIASSDVARIDFTVEFGTFGCLDDISYGGTGTATANDACGDVTVTYSDAVAPGDCPAESTITRTWTAVDACGNESSCPQIIMVLDTQAPDLMCATDVTIECDESTDPVNTGVSTATDECSDVTVTYIEALTTNELCLQVITRRWKATDACGNTSECDQVITIVDTTYPDLTCPDNVTIECDESTLPANTGMASATDNCNDLTITYNDDPVDGDCVGESQIIRVWTATDACGNNTSCTQLIEIFDTTPPVWTSCPDDLTVECTASIEPGDTGGYASATDACSDVTVSYADMTTEGDCDNEYTIERTWTATDDCGNNTSKVQTIEVLDTTPPVITCPGDVTVECNENTLPGNGGGGNVQNVAVLGDYGSADDQILASLTNAGYNATFHAATPSAAVLTGYEAILMVRNPGNGNADLAAWVNNGGLLITEWDAAGWALNTANLLNATSNGQGLVAANTPVTFAATAVGATLGTGLPNPYSEGCATEFFRDLVGLGAGVTVHGTTPDNLPRIIGGATGSGYSLVIGYCWADVAFCGGFAGSQSETMILNALNVGGGGAGTGTATAVDACGDVTITYSDAVAPGDCPAESTITRTWTAVDACGNESECDQTIMVLDTQAPDLMCATDVTIECDESTDPVNTGVSTATDECSDVTVTYQDALTTNELCLQVIQRRWKATDACGNTAECDQLITIVDTTAPDLTCAADVTIECDESTLPANTGMSVATDNCNDVTVTYNDDPGQGPCVGQSVIYRVWTATDACGNNTSCTQLIEIFDTQAPDWTYCPADLTVECDQSTDPEATGYASATDACSDVTVTYSDAIEAGDCINEMTITRTWTAVDDCGNSTSKPQVIEVLDTTPPVIVCPGDVTIECTDGTTPSDLCPEIDGFTSMGSYGGHCYYMSDASFDWTDAHADAGSNGGYIVAITSADEQSWIAGAISDNSLSFDNWIGLTDDETYGGQESFDGGNNWPGAPYWVWTSGEPVVYTNWLAGEPNQSGEEDYVHMGLFANECPWNDEDNTGTETNYQYILEIPTVTASDNCGNVTITYSDVTAAGDCDNEYTITRTWTAEDACGNTSECDQIIEIVDTVDPDLACAADITIECDDSTHPDNTGWSTATDACGDVTVEYTDATFEGECPITMVIQRRWTATDACGNTEECDQIIELYDLEGPAITCPDDITANADKFYCEKMQVEIGFPTWTDNCDEDVSVSYTRSDGADIGAAYPVGVTEIEWIVLGLCSGESDTCVQTITIVDSQPPTVICKKIGVALNDDEGLVMVPPQFLYDGVFDNCTDEEYLEGTITVSQTVFSCADYPQVLVEVCATDEAGNVGCCFATVKIQDNFAPNAVCQDVTIDAGGDPSVVITAADVDGGTTDNADDCGLDMEVEPSVFDADGNHDVTLTVTDIAGNVSTCTSTVTITGIPANNGAQITGKIWIEGAMNVSQTAMIPSINDLLPLEQPFNMAPFNYEGTETLTEIPSQAIDWVLVELRDEADPTMVIRTRAGLLMSDGYVKDLDGVTPITFDNLGDGMYYLSVRHRNHLGVISDVAMEILAGQGIHDFTTGGAMGAEPMKLMSGGAYALWCGDLNADNVIDAGDRSIAWNMRNQTGYLQADATMDGVVDASERSITWNNRNKASGLPQ